ncbi:hypothetical protein K2173_013285 [Erythroxylum novogranatense]|uniref:Cytochrome P450 family protein n=1 Tax=Erythroxylum novogranatense TaxID=1862640 RepID=A0AAV8S9P1_9ROSI|nr:hypothetical protein K2173_013285 [Erythroxylum novogranatense]
MAFLARASPTMPDITALRAPPRNLKPLKSLHIQYSFNFPKVDVKLKHSPVCCTKLTPWEPSPVSYAPTHESGSEFLEKTTSNIFDSLTSDEKAEALVTGDEEHIDSKNQPFAPFQFLKWTMWILGPTLLLTTGMVPTLWLPLSSIFIGPNIASLLSLIGLDCIFNLGVTLFLLMADSCAQPKNLTKHHSSSPPFQYKFWNMVATVSGFVTPLMLLFGSQKGFLQPQLPFISSAVLLGPYLLLLSVQILTEMLTWHWQSPVWLVTPIVYEAYRVLQLMRGLKLAAELVAPSWMLHMIRGLVSWWILILGVQLMSVAWFAGFTARGRKQLSYSSPDD